MLQKVRGPNGTDFKRVGDTGRRARGKDTIWDSPELTLLTANMELVAYSGYFHCVSPPTPEESCTNPYPREQSKPPIPRNNDVSEESFE